jgi:hypothetical protein
LLTLINPEQREIFEENAKEKSTVKTDFLSIWINENPLINKEVTDLLEKLKQHLKEIKKPAVTDYLNLEQKILVKKQAKSFEILNGFVKDLNILMKFGSLADQDTENNMESVIKILKID